MTENLPVELHPRERQIVDVLYRRGRASAADVHRDLPDPPSYSAVRAMLRKLENKGYVRHTRDGLTYIYEPTTSPEVARRSAVEHLLGTLFAGSIEQAMSTLFEVSDRKLTPDQVERLTRLIEERKREE